MEVDRGINSDDNGRDTPKESYELPTRIDTPGPIPKYMYSRVSPHVLVSWVMCQKTITVFGVFKIIFYILIVKQVKRL